jgi:hypothetical protein
MNDIRKAIEDKIQELNWKSEVKSILMVEWLQSLLAMIPVEEEKKEEPAKEIKVEIPERTEKQKSKGGASKTFSKSK